MLAEAHKKDWAGQHPELLRETSNRQIERKMDLPLENVSKIFLPMFCLYLREKGF
jgi:hypothetical protein